jgi:hypothetical protein
MPNRSSVLGVIAAVAGFVVAGAVMNSVQSNSRVEIPYSFVTADGAISASLPEKPTLERATQIVPGLDKPLSVEMYGSDLSRNRGGVGIAVTDFDQLIEQLPASQRQQARNAFDAEAAFQQGANDSAASQGGTVADGTPTTHDGHPAFDFRIQRSEPGQAQARLIYDRSEARMYMVLVTSRDGGGDLFERIVATVKISKPTPAAA